MKCLIALLLTCSSVLGQGFGSFTYDQPFLAKTISGSVTNYDPTGSGLLRWRWVFSDVTNSAVDAWRDRIEGSTYTNSNAGLRPTTNASGIFFDGTTKFLTNHSFISTSTNTSPLVAQGTLFCILTVNSAAAFADFFGSQTYFYGLLFDGSTMNWYYAGNHPMWSPLRNITQDWIWTMDDPSAGRNFYTNNILAQAIPPVLAINDGIDRLGFNGNGCFNGYIKELWWFTNVVNSTTRSNLHYYATNTYSYGP